jgi:PKD repeat protein
VIYRVYGKRDDDSLFNVLGDTTGSTFNTGHPWAQADSISNWVYTVVGVSTNQQEGPYVKFVENSSRILASFTSDLTGGSAPLSVTFTDHSIGTVTSYAWDFDSDGTIDSTEQSPTTVFAEAGTYTVTLTVSGPDGSDTRTSVGFVTVSKPMLSAISLLPDKTVEIGLTGQAGRNYEIQATTNITSSWSTVTNLVTTNATTIFTDTSATNYNQRFYRMFIP